MNLHYYPIPAAGLGDNAKINKSFISQNIANDAL
jgi:hypothetical protein